MEDLRLVIMKGIQNGMIGRDIEGRGGDGGDERGWKRKLESVCMRG